MHLLIRRRQQLKLEKTLPIVFGWIRKEKTVIFLYSAEILLKIHLKLILFKETLLFSLLHFS